MCGLPGAAIFLIKKYLHPPLKIPDPSLMIYTLNSKLVKFLQIGRFEHMLTKLSQNYV